MADGSTQRKSRAFSPAATQAPSSGPSLAPVAAWCWAAVRLWSSAPGRHTDCQTRAGLSRAGLEQQFLKVEGAQLCLLSLQL